MIVKTIQLYEDRPDVTLTTYVLSDSPEMLHGKKRPAVLICPGGAYLGCSDREGEPIALRFAAMGYHAFVLRYSTYNEGDLFSFEPHANMQVNPNSVYPGPLRDVGKAFLTIHAHADDWLVDTDKIITCGFSAGAHNCAMHAVYWNDPVITDYFGEDAVLFKPAATILGYGLADYRLMVGADAVLDEAAQVLSDGASIAYLGTTTPSQSLLDTVSPALHITAHTPPTFLWATQADDIVPVQNTTRMANALAEAGIPFEVHIFEDGEHGLSLADQATASNRNQIDADAATWVPLVEAWLKKRFALPV